MSCFPPLAQAPGGRNVFDPAAPSARRGGMDIHCQWPVQPCRMLASRGPSGSPEAQLDQRLPHLRPPEEPGNLRRGLFPPRDLPELKAVQPADRPLPARASGPGIRETSFSADKSDILLACPSATPVVFTSGEQGNCHESYPSKRVCSFEV